MASEEIRIIEVTADNVEEAGVCCIKDKKSPGFRAKVEWFRLKFNEGLKIRIALDNKGSRIGFIEYLPSENAWRPVKAENYLFIQCIAVYAKDMRSGGIGSMLIKECEDDARAQGKNGIFALASSGTWMANKALFEKCGFTMTGKKDRFDLMVKRFRDAAKPEFIDWEAQLPKYKGWNLIYADQCPWHFKSVEDISRTARSLGIDLSVVKLDSPEAAQLSPSGYGTFCLIHDGKVLADHYISETRFRSIVRQISEAR